MQAEPLPFRLPQDERAPKLTTFNPRSEILWFGFEGGFVEPGLAEIRLARLQSGALGGGGVAALNGGVIAAGFDAAFVLAGLGHFESAVVVTLELSVQFLSLARTAQPLLFRSWLTKSARGFGFAQGVLAAEAGGPAFATATAMVAPSAPRAVQSYGRAVAGSSSGS
jgi:acyl-coenzyme A thioesterase PaaI-like protein